MLILLALLLQDPPVVSHPPLRPLPPPAARPREKGPAFFVDALRGQDANPGTEEAPWKTVAHALPRLGPGDTLYLRGGVYPERLYCSVVGRPDAPVTIRAYPGERAIIDAGLPEFRESPATAWVPHEGGAPGEYRSARPYRNIRDVVGVFGDSHIGLQTYWHLDDLRATEERAVDGPEKKTRLKPMYCGPGLWYDKVSGFIHVRLAHTALTAPFAAAIPTPQVADYRGETDPRKVPLVIAPFQASALVVDQAMHVRFRDLVFRGGGYNTVVLQFGVDLDFDNVIVFAGTYGIRARNTGPLRFTNGAVYGMMAPWFWRTENGLYTFHPRLQDPFVPSVAPDPAQPGAGKGGKTDVGPDRNVARLPTHALVVTEGAEDSSVFAYPFNHDWEVAWSEFADAHDGVYFAGNTMRFHHNWVDNLQDDGIYLSSPTPSIADNVWVHQNLITRCVSAFAAHSRGGPTGDLHVLRNVVDLRLGVLFERPEPSRPGGKVTTGQFFLVHGRELTGIESMAFYHNTIVAKAGAHGAVHRALETNDRRAVRRAFNNLCVYLDGWPDRHVSAPKGSDIRSDGNLHWSPAAPPPAGFLEELRAQPLSVENRANWPPGWEASSRIGDPRFAAFAATPSAVNDYRLGPGSAALGAGVVLPPELEDPLRPADGRRPDVGALPAGSAPLQVGIGGRITAGIPGMRRE